MAVIYDTHIHSGYSADSETPLSSQIGAAQEKGLRGLCLTDHMDYDFPPFQFDETAYKEELAACRERYPLLWVGTGVECGLQPTDSVVAQNRALTAQEGWDFILGSVHFIDGQDPYYPSFWEGRNPAECVRRYLEILYESLCLFPDIDSLGHMDYVVRYAPAGFCYSPEEYRDIMDEILKLLIQKDIALEVNASGLCSAVGCENPHPSVLQRYAQLGGELVTIGSDAHVPERIAGKFPVLEQHIKEAGFHQYVTYHRRKPVFHDF